MIDAGPPRLPCDPVKLAGPSARPRLSVVMPTRNQVDFIASAITSVMAQADALAVGAMELVVADGSSTDGTQSVLSRMSERHPGLLHWTSEPDHGPADAVNKAVARARGDIIGWLNSDDLYLPGAAARALAVFDTEPDVVLVYGEGEHVDVNGHPLGRYPTRSMPTPLAAWADGCHICQPTAFFRRSAFDAVGGLDTGLATAFDYDFWLRLLRAFPTGIRQLDAVQALSRLHASGITLRMREQVALEGMQVVHRHLGEAPPHWLLTHVGEALAACPFDADGNDVKLRLLALADQAAQWMAPNQAPALKRQMQAHRAWQLLRKDLAIDVHADGWAPPRLSLRVRQTPARPHRYLRLWGRHEAPGGHALMMRLVGSADPSVIWQGGVGRPGPFQLQLPLPTRTGDRLDLCLESSPSFVPSRVIAGSQDTRDLACRIEAAELT